MDPVPDVYMEQVEDSSDATSAHFAAELAPRATGRRHSLLSLDLVSLHFPSFPGAMHHADPADSARRVFVNTPPEGEWADSKGRVAVRYASNAVKTGKYTLVTFVPKVGPELAL
jgi:hypothetical protein